MTNNYNALRQPHSNTTFKAGDVLVLFGELFNRGYANGLVEEAEKRGMKIIRSTVGRREKDGTLRPLNADEAAAVPKPFINIPLEAGFDLEPDPQGLTPVEQIKDVRLSEWENFQMNRNSYMESQRRGRERFVGQVKAWVTELRQHLPANSNILFAHLMAGGVPRTKIVMPLMNRALKGSGERFLSSEKFVNSSIGQFCLESFYEVTAETFNIFLQETSELREDYKKTGHSVAYVAYGYHGTEVLVGQNYLWQSYSPYVQGWAKMRLENYAREWHERGVTCSVYNCPEILTNSSSIFSGVEVSLYPLMGAIKKEGQGQRKALQVLEQCQHKLKEGHTLEEILHFTDAYLMSDEIRAHCVFEKWPQHNSQRQLEKMVNSSDHLIELHKNPKDLITALLSEVVFESCGRVMINDAPHPEAPVAWINHDIVARSFLNP